jgi:hypothetical protein
MLTQVYTFSSVPSKNVGTASENSTTPHLFPSVTDVVLPSGVTQAFAVNTLLLNITRH